MALYGKLKKKWEESRAWRKRLDDRRVLTKEGLKTLRKIDRVGLRGLALLEYSPQIIVNTSNGSGWNVTMDELHEVRMKMRKAFPGWSDSILRVSEQDGQVLVSYGNKIGRIQVEYHYAPEESKTQEMLNAIAPGCEFKEVTSTSVTRQLVCDKDKEV